MSQSTIARQRRTVSGQGNINLLRPVRVDWLSPLCDLYNWIGDAFWLAIFGGSILATIRRRFWSDSVLIMLAVGTAILARAFILGVLDVTSWGGLQVRNILPAVPAFACICTLGLILLGDAIVPAKRDPASPKRS